MDRTTARMLADALASAEQAANLGIRCGDCGDALAACGNVHADDSTPACSSRAGADARRDGQGRPRIGQ
jgi:hypothetical protein